VVPVVGLHGKTPPNTLVALAQQAKVLLAAQVLKMTENRATGLVAAVVLVKQVRLFLTTLVVARAAMVFLQLFAEQQNTTVAVAVVVLETHQLLVLVEQLGVAQAVLVAVVRAGITSTLLVLSLLLLAHPTLVVAAVEAGLVQIQVLLLVAPVLLWCVIASLNLNKRNK
jgi:hypothetical protein